MSAEDMNYKCQAMLSTVKDFLELQSEIQYIPEANARRLLRILGDCVVDSIDQFTEIVESHLEVSFPTDEMSRRDLWHDVSSITRIMHERYEAELQTSRDNIVRDVEAMLELDLDSYDVLTSSEVKMPQFRARQRFVGNRMEYILALKMKQKHAKYIEDIVLRYLRPTPYVPRRRDSPIVVHDQSDDTPTP